MEEGDEVIEETEPKAFDKLVLKMVEHPIIQLSEISVNELRSLSLLYTLGDMFMEDYNDKDLLILADYLLLLRHALRRKRERVISQILSSFRWRVSNMKRVSFLREKLIPFGKESNSDEF